MNIILYANKIRIVKRKLLHQAIGLSAMLFLLLSPAVVTATHIMGGEIGYRFLALGKYEIRLDLYQNCNFGADGFDDPAYIGIYDGEGNMIQSLPIAAMQADTISEVRDPECASGPSICVQHMIYKAIVELDRDPAGGYYHIAYQRCCRGERLDNIEKPGDTGAVYDIILNKLAIDRCNSSPVYRAWPPASICANKEFIFDHSASDINDHKHDSLVYRLCTPVAGDSRKVRPQPIPPDEAPPFDPVTWLNPDFSSDDPFGTGNAPAGEVLSIDPQTGILSGIPVTAGEYVIGVCVDEYDRETKELLSVTRRDFEIKVYDNPNGLTLEVSEGACSPDLESYAVRVSTNGILTTDIGVIDSIGENLYVVRNIPINRSATLTSSSKTVDHEVVFTTPLVGCDCDDVNIDVPVSAGDKVYCEGSAVPMLIANVPEGQTIDWYAQETGGEPLASGKIFQPNEGGVYYIEARDSVNSCTSDSRIPVELITNPKPTFVGFDGNIVCSEDLNTYQVTFTTDADLVQNMAGTLVDNDGGSYTVKDIPKNINVVIMLAHSTTGCTREETITAPTCSCDLINVEAPVSGSDKTICAGDAIPALMVTVPEGITVDWYDAATGGNPLATDNIAFIPASPGTYYAEAKHMVTNCTSATRTPVVLSVNELPELSIADNAAECSTDLSSYSLDFSSNADQVEVSLGTLVDNGSGNYSVTGIALNTDIIITATLSSTNCALERTITAPDCAECPENGLETPVSGGDQIICAGEELVPLTVTVNSGEIVDWYDAPVQGNRIAEATSSYTPTSPGVYYAEARIPNSTCTSGNRTSIRLIQNELPTYDLADNGLVCSEDRLTYNVVFTTDADEVSASSGIVLKNEDNYVLSGVDINDPVNITLVNTIDGCERAINVQPPNCEVDCEDFIPAAPISGGDKFICEGDPIPALEVSVPSGETVDWYDSEQGGTLLASNTTSYTPTETGTYYAEAKDESTNCPGRFRTAVVLAIRSLPSYTLEGDGAVCAEDMQSYSVQFTSDAEEVSVNSGTVVESPDNVYTVSGIDIAANLVIVLENASTGCSRTIDITAPDCSNICDDMDLSAPVSGGDAAICEGDDIPTLTATVPDGQTVDWYDSAEGGNVLATGTNSYTPSAGGTFFAEARNLVNDCTSNQRAAVTLNVSSLPSYELEGEGGVCAEDNLSYSLRFTSDAESVEISMGEIVADSDNSFTVSGIHPDSTLVITLTNTSTNCSRSETISPPDCDCPTGGNIIPISGGDIIICEGAPIPDLSATTRDGFMVDWYDAPAGGNLLKPGSNTFTPEEGGVFYAEAREMNSNCPAGNRVPVTLIVEALPDYTPSNSGPICSPDLQSFTITFVSNAEEVEVSEGVLEKSDNIFTVSNIEINSELVIKLTNSSSGCAREVLVEAPDCPECQDIAVPTPISGGDQTICEGDEIPTLTVTTQDGLAVDWYDQASGGTLLLSNSTTFTPTQGGTYYAEAKNQVNNCPSNRVPVSLTMIPFPMFNLAGNDPSCSEDGQTYGFSFNTNGINVEASAGEMVNAGGGNYTVNQVQAQQSVTITIGNAAGQCNLEMVIDPPNCPCAGITLAPPTPVADTITTCGEEIAPGLEISNEPGQIIDWYDAPTGGNLLLANNRVFTPDTPGTYYAESRTEDEQCKSERTPVTWAFREIPSFTQIGDPTCQPNLEFYDMAFLTDASLIEVSHGEMVKIGEGDYTIKNVPVGIQLVIELAYEDDPNCVRTELISAPRCSAICEDPYVFVPNAFTPNGDGSNDAFRVRGEAIESMKLMVYNRWGDEIFFAEDQSQEWDGTYKEETLPPGVYGYYLTVECVGGSSYRKKGNVTLIR